MLLISILNKIIMFVLVVIISLILNIVYNVASPIYKKSNTLFNFDPLPTVAPYDLPDSAMRGSTPQCLVTPTECNANGECAPCADNGNVTCSNPDNNVVYELPSGAKIPLDGKSYCIPTAATNMPCNRYTGKYVWTDSAELGQEWKCECLYPDLFNNPQTGCTNQVACTNVINRDISNTLPKTKYKLVDVDSLDKGSDDHKSLVIWDPLKGDTDVLKNNPYSVKEDGSPRYVCACGIDAVVGIKDNETTPPYLRLPGDPYNCHVDSCDELQGYQAHVMNDGTIPGCKDDNCDCLGANGQCGTNPGTFVIKIGDKKGKCYSNDMACNEINDSSEMNKDFTKCVCQKDSYQRMCVSEFVSRDQIEEADEGGDLETCVKDSDCLSSSCDPSGVCRCQNPLNPIGTECVSMCYPNNPCLNNTYCKPGNSGKTFSCDCNTDVAGVAKTDQGFFNLGVNDCGDKPIRVKWGNKDDDPKGKCNTLIAESGTQVYEGERQCIVWNAWFANDGVCLKTKESLADIDDIPMTELLADIGAGVTCPGEISYEEGRCGSLHWTQFGNGKITSKATCK